MAVTTGKKEFLAGLEIGRNPKYAKYSPNYAWTKYKNDKMSTVQKEGYLGGLFGRFTYTPSVSERIAAGASPKTAYEKRIARGLARGLSVSQARGHARKAIGEKSASRVNIEKASEKPVTQKVFDRSKTEQETLTFSYANRNAIYRAMRAYKDAAYGAQVVIHFPPNQDGTGSMSSLVVGMPPAQSINGAVKQMRTVVTDMTKRVQRSAKLKRSEYKNISYELSFIRKQDV